MIRQLINLTVFKSFLQSASAGGLILIVCVILSLVVANSPLGPGLETFLATEVGYASESIGLRYPILLWVNDGLMAIFFLLVGLEIKRELVEGELSSFKQAALPIFAALGGVAVPAIIYSLFNMGTPTASGWGIPMATDIAFAIGLLSLLGNRVPLGLKIFLTALAIVDDLVAILVIAVFYSTDLHLQYLLYVGGLLALLVAFNRLGITNLLFYLVPGAVMWYFIHHSGVHATLAGVLTALTIPTNETDQESPLERLEHAIVKPVNFLIMPIFAFVNTNIRFEESMVAGLASPLGLGILLGLFLGKPIGIMLLSWLSVRLRISSLPSYVTWGQMLGAGLLAGVGFTMSIFIALLSFQEELFQTNAKFAILVASLVSGLAGYLVLKNNKGKNIPDELENIETKL
ncbi:Na+/H+ antiporter NhaA [Rufibacter glacialis]|uniref:Na(+)/H(+) antiporter NhaA n=1 Tax=Rufibacter glacialis TaxID=1259555 RepID=A0A5M8QBD7_9BACT|nr:Na+/H+ antiporter NhaA [Rufibacter glacialis]KAA6432361.1 Na+/H+ antiporter NhaA [Rufibacter glacialis]GGK78063.1 Na(+)/H(+) antiporter NhaA [Rufibacter glacialis]